VDDVTLHGYGVGFWYCFAVHYWPGGLYWVLVGSVVKYPTKLDTKQSWLIAFYYSCSMSSLHSTSSPTSMSNLRVVPPFLLFFIVSEPVKVGVRTAAIICWHPILYEYNNSLTNAVRRKATQY
jgi:hypothetical protein